MVYSKLNASVRVRFGLYVDDRIDHLLDSRFLIFSEL